MLENMFNIILSVSEESFGVSDPDHIGYTHFSKDPPTPVRTKMKRNCGNFNPEDLLWYL